MCLGVLLSPCDIHQGNCTSEPELSLIVGVQRLDYRLQRITSLNLYLFGINMSYLLEAQRRLGVKDKGNGHMFFFVLGTIHSQFLFRQRSAQWFEGFFGMPF